MTTDAHAGHSKASEHSSALTAGHIFGELVHLASACSRLRDVSVGALSEFLLPPIGLKQFHLFRDGGRSVGAAIWANLDAEGEGLLKSSLEKPVIHLEPRHWNAGERLWLLELISPYATEENRHVELMMGDLILGPLRDRSFKLISHDPETAKRSVSDVGAGASSSLQRMARDKLVELGVKL